MECDDPSLLLSSSLQSSAEACLRQAEILKLGDLLRFRMHHSKLIKDRSSDNSTYPSTFMANEAVNWLLEKREAPDRPTGVKIMKKYFKYDVIHHVCDSVSSFRDAKLLYRFRDDDGTLMQERQTKLLRRAERMYMRMLIQEDTLLRHKQPGSELYSRIFQGRELVDWLIQNREVSSRLDGESLCRTMVEYGILQHVSRLYHFSDSAMLYQFAIAFRRKRKIIEILDVRTAPLKHDSDGNQSSLLDLCAALPFNDFVLAPSASNTEPMAVSIVERRGGASNTYYLRYYKPPPSPLRGPPSVLSKPVSVEELLEPGAPYLSKSLTILGDDVGWGFVIRGTGPCHVQAVDPGGPAAGAGMKVRQFLHTVNGMCSLRLDYQTINRLIVAGPRRLVLEVLEPFD
ncbi:DEP domain-containing mTOR-interacting protein-like [Pelobates fuscus]|uniref:DEP domain-containing mTOR-interacting protein-like n=1 Tax=Pelobates fuscus TaxID=191477 RepID=UPI002FE44CFE